MKDFNGFIKIHRQLIEWEWYSNINCRITLIHCILKANFKDKRWQGHLIKRGSFATSLSKLSDEIGISIKALRIVFEKLEKTGVIIAKGQGMHTLVTVVNFDNYQKKDTQFDTTGAKEGQDKGKGGAEEGQQLKNDKKEKKESNIIDFEYCIDCDSRSEDFRNTSFGIKDAQQTLQNIYEPKGWLIAKVKELTEADRSQEWCYNVLHDFATTGITNYHSRITCPNKLNDKFCNWIKNAIKFEQENEAKAKKENKSLSMNDHLKANMIPKNYNYIKRKGKLNEYIADFKNYEFKYNNIAKAYKNKSITAPLIYEIAHTSLGRGLHGTTELKKIDSLKAFVNNLSDYNQSQGDIRKLIQEHSKKTDL